MTCGVYQLSTPSGRCYVGSSVNIEARYRAHRNEARRGTHCNRFLQAAFRKHGELRLDILETCDPSVRLIREQHFLDRLRPEMNHSSVAGAVDFTDDVRSRIASGWTPERRERTRQAILGNKRCVGRVETPEANERRAEGQRKRVWSAASRAKLSASHKNLWARRKANQHV